MLPAVSIAAFLLLVIVATQACWANRFVALYREENLVLKDSELPHVGVLMALRGADPYLEDCLRALMQLDYPSHEIRIIVDNETDPAFEVVKRVCEQQNATHVTVEVLDVCQYTCSLKNLALIQGIRGCSDRCQAFAWLDSDTVPYPSWLRDLVSPLQDDSVGVACGIRWYAPPNRTLANHVRHIWNAAAICQMVVFGIGWGGAFAIRRDVYEGSELALKWGQAMTEDTVASNEVLAVGKRVVFVAAATMQNPESATLSWCVNFVTRQLQLLRFYHRAWIFVLTFGLFSGLVLVALIGLTTGSFFVADYVSGMLGIATLLFSGTVVVWLMNRSEKTVIESLKDRSVGTVSSPWQLIVAAPVTQLVHAIALVRTYLLSSVTWRGIRYELRAGQPPRRTNYQPYVSAPAAQDATSQHSL